MRERRRRLVGEIDVFGIKCRQTGQKDSGCPLDLGTLYNYKR